MDLYFAPLEGVTTYTLRNTHFNFFGGCTNYFAPFITPTENDRISEKNLRDILPENNSDVNLKIQALCNHAPSFLDFAQKVKEYGYDEININFGCPSSTVVKKGRGAGLLKQKDILDRFLYEIFEKTDMKISIKTRAGYFDSEDEIEDLINIYNKYPLSCLIIHPRSREDYYKGKVHMEAFKKAYLLSNNPLCYNGDILTVQDFLKIKNEFPKLHSIMIGRGAIKNPALFREINGGKKLTKDELILYTKKLAENYYEILNSDTYTLHKLKEIWTYIMQEFDHDKKTWKAIKKANRVSDLLFAIEQLKFEV